MITSYNILKDSASSSNEQEAARKELKRGLFIPNKQRVSRIQLLRAYEEYDWNQLYEEYQIAILTLDLPKKPPSPRWVKFEEILNQMSKHPYVVRYSKNEAENRSHFYKTAIIKINSV